LLKKLFLERSAARCLAEGEENLDLERMEAADKGRGVHR
jgi:hypothetical protein